MPIENLPDQPEDIINLAAKAGYLKASTSIGEIKLNSYNSIEVQPKGTLFGAKIKVENNGNVVPTLTFDTKKLRDKKKNIDTEEILDNAIQEFWEQDVEKNEKT